MFKDKIRELRIEKGLSQLELAQKLGYTQSMVSFWERGIHEPTESVIRKTATFFEVSTDYLLGLEE